MQQRIFEHWRDANACVLILQNDFYYNLSVYEVCFSSTVGK